MTQSMKRNSTRAMALLLAFITVISLLSIPAYAYQVAGYHDPAEHWLSAANRTSEFDANAIITYGSGHCGICGKITGYTAYRVPEYSTDGKSALTRNVKYSDGTCVDGVTTGTILSGTPGVNAYYTGCHWTKTICDVCGSPNTFNMGPYEYPYNQNIYWLYTCDSAFTQDLDEIVNYEYADSTYHLKTTTGGDYCGFCYGTHHIENSILERHDLERSILSQPANGRFAVVTSCTLCDFVSYQYVAAKSVIADYYGVVDGHPHTLTVTDLSEAGVHTQIRYGNSADSCTLTSAPNYTEEGQYTVYYQITYTYQNTSMTEDGVAYVWLQDESTSEDGNGCACGCDDPNCGCQSNGCNGDCCMDKGCGDHHNFILLDSTQAGCLTLGYDRYLCSNCGKIEKRDYTAALGHVWQGVVVREATCETDGKLLEICSRCGQVKVTATPKGEHQYATYPVAATCTNPGYTVKECEICGDRHITDVTSALPHNYESIVTPANCEGGGYTLHLCEGCGSSFVTDYTEALGHKFDKGTPVTNPSCNGEGVTEFRCERCGYHYLEGSSAKGHTPDHDATCTEPSTCTSCGAVLKPANGHKESNWMMDQEPTTEKEGTQHKECVNCGTVLKTEKIDKIYLSATTDSHGEAVVGGYLVIVTDTDTKNPVANASVALNKNGSISIRLPNGRLIDYADQTTVQVQLVKDKSPVSNLLITVTDKNSNYAAGVTDKAGQITVPGTSGKTNGDGNSTVGYEDEDGNRFTITVKVEDYETGRPIEDATVTIGKTGNVTVVLPDGTEMDKDNRITITVTDNRKEPLEDENIIVKGDLGQKAEGKTDQDGKLTVPAVSESERHTAYIVGFPDGTFGSEKNMTRSEATAIFARLLAAKNGDVLREYGTFKTKFVDVPTDAWYASSIKYLTNYGVVTGCGNGSFCPEHPITRAEFTAMAVRFFEVYGNGDAEIIEKYAEFSDVSDGYWAAKYIKDAAIHGWVFGYEDGTFGAEKSITRAEVVTLVNRLLGREADKSFVNNNLRKLNTFSDMTDKKHWAYYAVMEASNTHTGTTDGTEIWIK